MHLSLSLEFSHTLRLNRQLTVVLACSFAFTSSSRHLLRLSSVILLPLVLTLDRRLFLSNLNMLTQTSNFLDDSTGIEKTLRLAQGLCTVLAGFGESAAEIAPWATAKSQINLGRRYLRLHKWHPCFRAAYHHATRSDLGALEKLLEMAKWSFLGLYFLLEMPTITNSMGVTSFEWGPQLQLEALKFWFYGIAVSMLLGYYQLTMLFFSSDPAPASTTDEKASQGKDEEAAAAQELAKQAERRSRITTQLVIDHCDIFLPGSAVGWIPADQIGVGICQSISSVLAMQQVWERVASAGG